MSIPRKKDVEATGSPECGEKAVDRRDQKPNPPSEPNLCCGSPSDPPSLTAQRAGYRVCAFVEGFVETEAGRVARVRTRLGVRDILGGIGARLGGYRDNYRVAPGLYCVGRPASDSVVLVTANYKLSFDALRKELQGLDAWILVLDTRGINVWCAAAKKIFSSEEVVRRLKLTGLEKIVTHGRLVLPQLCATGVSAVKVKKESGFQVIWGPVKARDVREFIKSGMTALPRMRSVTFTLWERAVLVPIEVSHLLKPALWILLGAFLLSGIGPRIFSFGSAWTRGIPAALALAACILSGAVIAPVLLPWLPGKAFSMKGAFTGLIAGLGVIVVSWGRVGGLGSLALILFATALSSYLTMNFTGSTPFTSASGVEKEMRKAIPFQATALLVALAGWIGSAFVG